MTAQRVYLDHNATAPLLPAAADAMASALAITGNPSSVHADGRIARRMIDDARDQVAALVGAEASQVIFTSGGTEANDLALAAAGPDGGILVTAVEHDSVLAAAPGSERLPVDRDGVLDLSALEERLVSASPALVSVMLANNETGVLQPVREAAELAHRYGARIHCDATQGVGRIEVNFRALGVDLMTLSAHKIGGPAGIGALIAAPGVEVAARIRGGGQERGRRAGTENRIGIVGFGAAAAAIKDEIFPAALRDFLEAELSAAAPEAVIHGRNAARLPNTSLVGLAGLTAETQVMSLDLAGFSVSAGAACSSGKVRASHVLRAMGVEPVAAGEAIRISLGRSNTELDIRRFVEAWEAMRARCLGRRRVMTHKEAVA